MVILSLFDGMSCGQIALRELGVTIDKYYASEIDKFAIQNTMANFPDTVQLGDVRQVDAKSLGKIDLLIGGSPCQCFSFAGKRAGVTPIILMMPLRLNLADKGRRVNFNFKQRLEEGRHRHIKEWTNENLSPNLVVKRINTIGKKCAGF